MSLAFDARKTFFDRAAVMAAVGHARGQALSKFGAYVRQAARSSIRKAKGPAPPGKPPHSHVGTLKRLLYFGFDTATASVVVGPVPFAAGTAPRVLELGGRIAGRPNRRRRTRAVGGAGEIRIGGRACQTTKDVRDWHDRTVQVTYAKIHTAAQANRANRLNEELYGPAVFGPAPLEARPYMDPALKTVLPQLPPLWANSVH